MRTIIGMLGAAGLLAAPAAMAQPVPPPGGPRLGPEAGAPPPGGPRRGPDGPPPPPPPKGAHLRFERGDAKVDVKGADDEPLPPIRI